MCILLYVIYYQINYFFYIKMHCYFSFQWCTLKRKSWLREKTLPKMDRASSSDPATQKSERGAHLCSSLLCSCHPVLWKPQFLQPSNKLKPLTALQEPTRLSAPKLQNQPPVDWAATECEAFPEYRQTLLHSPAHTVYTNLMHSFVIYIQATGSLCLEKPDRYAQTSRVGFLLQHTTYLHSNVLPHHRHKSDTATTIDQNLEQK